MKIAILHVSDYDFFTDDGENIKGSKLTYLIDNEEKNFEPITFGISENFGNMDLRNKIDGPGIYEATFKQVIKKNNIVSVISDLNYFDDLVIF